MPIYVIDGIEYNVSFSFSSSGPYIEDELIDYYLEVKREKENEIKE